MNPSKQNPPLDRTELKQQVMRLEHADQLFDALAGTPNIYLVGGAVRDLLLGELPTDYDLVVVGDALPVAHIAAERLSAEVIEYERFHTATVKAPTFQFDLATARRESYRFPGVLPEIHPSNLIEDLKRRDFTVNAIALAVNEPDFGELTWAGSAIEDLNKRQLRILHEHSFVDDPTRILRLLRYQSRLGFAIEKETRRLALAAVAQSALSTITSSRIGSELKLGLRQRDGLAFVEAVHTLGIDGALHPHLELDNGLAQRALDLLADRGRPDLLLLSVWSRELSRQQLFDWLASLAFESRERQLVIRAVVAVPPAVSKLKQASRPSEIGRLLQAWPPELIALAGALGAQEQAQLWFEELAAIELEINGDDLLNHGVRQGPQIGAALRAAIDAKRDGLISGLDDELEIALRAARGL